MKKYEYKVVQDYATKRFSLDDVNALGQEGWRVVSYTIADGGQECCLLERERTN